MDATRGAETGGRGPAVACRLVVDGKVIEFELPGPLVAMTPAGTKTEKRHKKTRRGK